MKTFSPIVRHYFTIGVKEATRVPVFYGTAKVHKGIVPDVPFRPIISQCGSLSALISTYIDVQLQPFTHHMPAYVKNSYDIITALNNLPELPPLPDFSPPMQPQCILPSAQMKENQLSPNTWKNIKRNIV